MPADVVPVARLVAGPEYGVAVRTGPSAYHPYETTAIAVLFDAFVGSLSAIEGKLVARANPSYVELAEAATVFAHLAGNLFNTVFGPKSGMEAALVQFGNHRVKTGISAAVAVVRENPSTGHVVLNVLIGDQVDYAWSKALKASRGGSDGFSRLSAAVVAVGIAHA